MEQIVNTFLKSYSPNPIQVDRLLVSAFLQQHSIFETNNKLINNHIIRNSDDDFEYLQKFLQISDLVEFENLIEIFEFVISPADKIVTGAVYTPRLIREFIVDSILPKANITDEYKVCDPACGCAGFLYTATIKLKEITGWSYSDLYKKNIYGLDIKDYSIQRSKILLSLLAIINGEDEEQFTFNFKLGNALGHKWADYIENFHGFDLIIGNPPYVCSRNIDDESRMLLSNWEVCSSGHPDLYIPFFELGIDSLKEGGMVGYITMNTFFKSLNGRGLRKYFKDNSFYLKILDFGNNKVFKSKSTYTCICLIQKQKSNSIGYNRLRPSELNNGNLKFKNISYDLLNAFEGWNLHDIETNLKIESIGTPLGNLFQTRNGIATLRNSIYIFTPVSEDEKYYYPNNQTHTKIEKGICRDIVNPNMLTRVKSLAQITQKIIFPYVYSNNSVEILEEDKFITEYPEAYAYLLANKGELAKRDKGKGNYVKWYAFGRTQSLEKMKNKLFFPHIAPKAPNFVIDTNEDLLFHNGIAVISDNVRDLHLLSKIMGTRLFWHYISNTSKPYESSFYSLSRNYIKNFGIYPFSEEQIQYIVEETDDSRLNKYIEKIYEIDLD